jgi:EAL domain-containing protein (putative c-di-GMP-specific phosphodiesterase class I)
MAILDAIMGLGQGLGLTVTAEGVETRTQLEYLKRIGCHEVQGFLLGRPMSNDELMSRISRPAAVNVAGALA